MILHNKTKVGLSLLSSLLGFFIPIILYLVTGTLESSISTYHLTDAKWYLFTSIMLISGGFFVGKQPYMISGLLLISVGIFNIEYSMIHNILAGLF